MSEPKSNTVSDTPRINSIIEQNSSRVPFNSLRMADELAKEGQKLERELAAMTERANHWCDMHTVASKEVNALRARVAELEKALGAMVDLKDHYEIHPRHRSIVQDAIIALNLTVE